MTHKIIHNQENPNPYPIMGARTTDFPDCRTKSESYRGVNIPTLSPTQAILVTVDGIITPIKPANGTDFQIEELYKAVDCQSIESINIDSDDYLMIGDEDARMFDGAKVNDIATKFYRECFNITDPVRQWAEQRRQMEAMGVIVCGDDDFPPFSVVGNVVIMPQNMLR